MENLPGKLIVFEGGDGVGKTTQLQRTAAWLAAVMAQLGRPPLCVTREPGGTLLGQQLRQVLLHRSEVPLGDRAELLLYGADRAQHVTETVIPALATGRVVLCDRYTDSTVAYQGYGRQLDRGLIDQVNQLATGGLVPDLTLWLDADMACTWERRQRRQAAQAVNSQTVNSPAVNSQTVNSPAVNSQTVNSPAVNSQTVNSPAVNSQTVNSPAVNPQAMHWKSSPPNPAPPCPTPPPPVTDRMEQADRAFHERVRQGFQALAAAHPERIVRIGATGTVDEVFGQIQGAIADRWAQWYGQALPVGPTCQDTGE